MTIHQRIRQLREDRHWLQKELAEKVSVSVEAVKSWEMGRAVPDSPNRHRLAQIFGITEFQLFTERHEVDPTTLILARLGYPPERTRALTESDWRTIRTVLEPVLRGLLVESPPPTMPTPVSPRTPSPAVFMVDDEAKLCHVMKTHLEFCGLTVDYAFTGKQAIQRLLTDHLTPGVILLDLRMPEMHGIEFIKRLRKINTRSKLVIWSGYPEDLCNLDTSGLGYDALYEKPTELSILVAKIQELLCLDPHPNLPNNGARSDAI